MHCTFHAYLINDNFSQEHADAQYNGEESENNRKFLWEDELKVNTEVSEVICHQNGIYLLKGEYPKDNFFEYEVTDMLLFELKNVNSESIFLGASIQLVADYSIEKNNDHFLIKLFLKDNEPFSDPVPGIYIASHSFPKELVF